MITHISEITGFRMYLQAKLENASKTKDEAMQHWLANENNIAGSAWCYLGKIADAEVDIRMWAKLIEAMGKDEGVITVERVLTTWQEDLIDNFRVPSPSSQISNAVGGVQIDAYIRWLRIEIPWLLRRIEGLK